MFVLPCCTHYGALRESVLGATLACFITLLSVTLTRRLAGHVGLRLPGLEPPRRRLVEEGIAVHDVAADEVVLVRHELLLHLCAACTKARTGQDSHDPAHNRNRPS